MANRFVIAAAALVAPIAMLSGCDADEQAGEQTTTTETTTPVPAGTERLTSQLRTADGRPVANATFDFANGFATVTVETVGGGILSPGFHGLHIHSVGKCEANSVAPTGGEPGDFLSAGGHLHTRTGAGGHPGTGDLTPLPVRSDGSARLAMTTDAFTAQDLLGEQRTALIIHQDRDNFAHIPDRYSQPNGARGPDQETMATGDAGPRVACGVIESASATTTTTTTTTPAPPAPGTVTETTVISPTPVVPPPVETTPTGTPTVTTTTPPTTTTPVETTTTTTTTVAPPPG
jgi:Cu-Zn family superoxide dismutase